MRTRSSRRPIAASVVPPQAMYADPQQHVHFFFDGACRDNGRACARSAFGVHCTWEGGIRRDLLPGIKGNNAAEILAACEAFDAALAMVRQHGPRSIVIHGDSLLVMSALRDGRTTAFSEYDVDNISNGVHWKRLSDSQARLVNANGRDSIQYEWVRRTRNVEADELANSALDGRLPDPTRRSDHLAATSVDVLDDIVRRLRTRRLTTLRSIPARLLYAWKATFSHVVRSFPNPVERRYVIIMLPHLISLRRSAIHDEEDFALVRDHITLLAQDDYLRQAISELHAKLNADPIAAAERPPHQVSSRRAKTLVKLGLFSKVLQDDDSTPAPCTEENVSKIMKMFPQHELPAPLPTPEAPFAVTLGETLNAIRRLRRGKCPGLSGWTKELLSPCVFDMPDDVQAAVVDMMVAITNDALTDVERLFLRDGILLPFQYASKPGKLRPVIILDTLVKTAWHIVLASCPTEEKGSTSHVFGRSGACRLALGAIQAALDADHVVISLDAVNAFNTIKREAAFDYLRRHARTMGRLFPMVNLMYATASQAHWFDGQQCKASVTVSAGTRQGCVSGMEMLVWATLAPNRKFSTRLTQAADDVNIVSSDSLEILESVIEEYASVGQDLKGPKMKVVCSQQRQREVRDKLSRMTKLTMTAEQIDASIHTTPTKLLGGCVFPLGEVPEACPTLTELMAKLSKRYKKITQLDVSLQMKWLILKNITFYSVFYIEHWGQHAQRIADFIDMLQMQTFAALFHFSATPSDEEYNDRFNNLFSPIEEGGLGLLPYSHLVNFLQRRQEQRVYDYVNTFNLGARVATSEVKHTTLRKAWMTFWETLIKNDPTVKRMRPAKAMRGLSLMRYASFLELLPINKWVEFTDEEFEFAVRLRMKAIKPSSFNCKMKGDVGVLSPQQFTDHLISCTSCSTGLFHRRHEAIVTSMHRVCRHHAYDTRLISPQQRQMTLPGNERGGPDLKLTQNGVVYAIDVTVVKEASAAEGNKDRMHERFTDKKKKYADYEKAYKEKVLPFVMSAYGLVAPDTLAELVPIYRVVRSDTAFRTDLLTIPQCQMLKATKVALDQLIAQEILNAAQLP